MGQPLQSKSAGILDALLADDYGEVPRSGTWAEQYTERLKAVPVEGQDYHCHRFKTGETIPPHYARSSGTRKDVVSVMGREPFLTRWRRGQVNPSMTAGHPGWAAVPGMKPKKEWGEVCL